MSKFYNLDILEDNPSPKKVKKKLRRIDELKKIKKSGKKLSKEQEEMLSNEKYWRSFIELDIDMSKTNKVKVNKKNNH